MMEDEDYVKPSILETTNWINEHKYAAIRMPTHMVEMPPEEVASRLQYDHHVETVMKGMVVLQDFTKFAEVAFIWPDDKPLPPRDNGIVSPLDQDDLEFLLDEEGPITGRWVVCGAHRVKAWEKCRTKFKKNPKYKNLYAFPIICRESDKAKRLLQNWGDLDNQKNASMDVSYCDRMRRCRQEFEAFERDVANGKIKPNDVSESRVKVKKMYLEIAGLSDGGFTQLWTLCTKSKPVFSRMYKLFQGKVQPPTYTTGKKKKLATFKLPRSASNFVHIGNIPDKTLCGWMDQIIAGEHPCKWLAEMCRRYKAKRRVMKEICSLVTSLAGMSDRIKWDECKAQYPQCCDKAQVKLWANNVFDSNLKDKAPMPNPFVDWVRDAYTIGKIDIANRANAEELTKVSSLHVPMMKLIR
jgi:hypothetical protein